MHTGSLKQTVKTFIPYIFLYKRAPLCTVASGVDNVIEQPRVAGHAEESAVEEISAGSCSGSIKAVSGPKWINVLKPPDKPEELDHFAPFLRPTFTLAAYVDKSDTLKQFVHLGTDIFKWERDKSICTFIMKRSFEELKPYILFLHDLGVPDDKLGMWLSENPHIFREEVMNLQARLNYLESKKFTKEQITSIVLNSPKWISFSVMDVDAVLGQLQKRFALTGNDVRHVAALDPELIVHFTDKPLLFEMILFTFAEEMGFVKEELKKIIKTVPSVFREDANIILDKFDFVHNEMGVPHQLICTFPQILKASKRTLEERHTYLKAIGRSQYDPKLPNYVSLKALFEGDDAYFCTYVAKTSIVAYNDYLRTL